MNKDSREDYDRWWAAIRFLQREDHYISVMIRLAGLRPLAESTLKRYQTLFERKSVSPQEFDEVKARRQAALARRQFDADILYVYKGQFQSL